MFARGRYGIEYNPQRKEGGDGAGLRLLFVLVAAAAAISLVWTLVVRFRAAASEREAIRASEAETRRVEKKRLEQITRAALAREREKAAAALAASNAVLATALPAPSLQPQVHPLPVDPRFEKDLARRPVKLRNLLMRLEEAERTKDVELAVSTIEQIRKISAAADLDDALARRLGTLNLRKLFALRTPLWVDKIVVKPRSSPSRIASEHGSTLASLERLNGGRVGKLVAGQPLYVMRHPRFELNVHARLRTADLQLNGKFFKRYDLTAPVTGRPGPYEIGSSFSKFCNVNGLSFRPADRAEIETLLPRNSTIVISEM